MQKQPCVGRRPFRRRPVTRGAGLVLLGLLALSGCMDPSLAGSGLVNTGITIADAPASVSDIDIRVQAPDFGPLTFTVNRTIDALVFELPVGKNRLFEGRAGTYYARTLASVTPSGANVGLNFSPVAVVPDFLNNRLVQFWRTEYPVWEELTEADIFPGLDAQLNPTDIDFDSQGRIVVGNNDSIIGNGVIILDSIYDTTPQQIGSATHVQSISVDRSRGIIYFVAGNLSASPGIFRMNAAGSTQPVLTDTLPNGNGAQFSRLSIDPDGFLYIAAGTEVYKYNPGSGQFVAATSVSAETIEDIQVVAGKVFLATPFGPVGQQILRLSSNLDIESAFGFNAGDPATASPGEFYGLRRFVTDRIGRLIVIDETFSTVTYDRLVILNPQNPGTWRTFGTSGTGTGQFNFTQS